MDARTVGTGRKFLSGKDILATEFVGMWKDREDIAAMGTDAFARKVREGLFRHAGDDDS